MAKYEMKYMFDWGSGTCIWSTNDSAIDTYDYPVNIKQLPISEELKNTLLLLVDKHDEALNWENPAGELLWNQEQVDAFGVEARAAYALLCDELNDDFQITLFNEECI